MTHTSGASIDDLGVNETPSSYYYNHPWGWSSQAAHWAMTFAHYRWRYGVGEDDLYDVARQLREHAMAQPSAVMRKPLALDDYVASRFIVRPLRLFDMCIVNDGAVCLIVRRADMARGLANAPVDVRGWGQAKVVDDKMDCLVRERLRPQLQEAGRQALSCSVDWHQASIAYLPCSHRFMAFLRAGRSSMRSFRKYRIKCRKQCEFIG